MKFGHHGANHPVRDMRSGKVFVTSQNHGFAVDEKTLPKDVIVWCKNANDGSLEGILSETKMILSVQFHPEAAPGPRDSLWIFDSFLRMMGTEEIPRSMSYA
jgi:carbamoyl-phosphate synthase small subunit